MTVKDHFALKNHQYASHAFSLNSHDCQQFTLNIIRYPQKSSMSSKKVYILSNQGVDSGMLGKISFLKRCNPALQYLISKAVYDQP